MTSAGSASLGYDPAGRLREVASGGSTTRFLYDGADLIAEYNGSGTLLRRYVHGPGTDEPLIWYESTWTSNRSDLFADERGSILRVEGSTNANNTYDAYGRRGSGNTGRFQYTGQTWLSEAGLYYYKARMYNPDIGRFMQTDPIGYGDGMNWYNYVGSDPVNGTDPSGLITCRNGVDENGKTCATVAPPTPKPNCNSLAFYWACQGLLDALSHPGWTPPNEPENDRERVTVTGNRPLTRIQIPVPRSPPLPFSVPDSGRPEYVPGMPLPGSGCYIDTWWIKLGCPPSADVPNRPNFLILPGDRGSEEWARRHPGKGLTPDEARRRFHRHKQRAHGRGKDDYTVDPDTGDIFDHDGEWIGNLGEEP